MVLFNSTSNNKDHPFQNTKFSLYSVYSFVKKTLMNKILGNKKIQWPPLSPTQT